MDASEQWWVHVEGQEMGPFTRAQVADLARAQHVDEATPASHDQAAWQPLGVALGQPWEAVIAPPPRVRPIARKPPPTIFDETPLRMPASIVVAIVFVVQAAFLNFIIAGLIWGEAGSHVPAAGRSKALLVGAVLLIVAVGGGALAVALARGRIWARNLLVVLWSLGLFYSLITIGEEPVLLGLLGLGLQIVALWAVAMPSAGHYVNKATALRLARDSPHGRQRT
ncbi:MAG: DUF4339 domain-containing protein [Planctomycetota bacterium]